MTRPLNSLRLFIFCAFLSSSLRFFDSTDSSLMSAIISALQPSSVPGTCWKRHCVRGPLCGIYGGQCFLTVICVSGLSVNSWQVLPRLDRPRNQWRRQRRYSTTSEYCWPSFLLFSLVCLKKCSNRINSLELLTTKIISSHKSGGGCKFISFILLIHS